MHPVIYSINSFELFGKTIGPLHIYSYGVFLALSFLFGLILFLKDGKRAGIKAEDLLDQLIYIIIFSIVGSRVMYVILAGSDYAANPIDALKIYEGGLSFHGGAIGGIIAVFYFSWRKGIPGWLMADTAIRPLILGAATARIGCFLNGCCYGHEWHGPWAIIFPSLHDGIPRHPAQFYDLGLHLVLLVAITFLYKYKKKDGDISAFYLVGFSMLRFTTEIFRKGATGKVFIAGLTQAQVASFGILAVGIFLYFYKRQKLLKASQQEKTEKDSGKATKKKNGKKKKKK